MLSEVIDKGPHACGQVAIWRINSIQTELIGCELGQQLFQPSILESIRLLRVKTCFWH